jgi:FMN-dependent NADH-azoreductase
MTTILQINASVFGEGGQSTRLAQSFVEAWRRRDPETEVILRDLAREPVPHLTGDRVKALMTPEEGRGAAEREVVAYSDALIDELRRADIIVLGLPMYNFGVPSTLKAYFDHVARAGVTFRYTAEGPVGLLGDKPLYVLAARGGLYEGTPRDTQTGYVREYFGFLGIHQIEFVYAEGLNMGPEQAQAALARARARIGLLAA